MDYSMNQIIIEVHHDEGLEQFHRILAYCHAMKESMYGNSKKDNSHRTMLKKLWDKEIELEQRIYDILKTWEERHPIMGIILCTILLGILISLIAGIILEAIY